MLNIFQSNASETYIQTFSNDNKALVNGSLEKRYTYEYDSSGNILSVLFESGSPMGIWSFFSKKTFTYSASNMVLSSTHQVLDNTGNLHTDSQAFFIYNSENKVTEVKNMGLNNQMYGNLSLYDYSYTASGLPDSMVISNWVCNSASWYRGHVTVYKYDDMNRLINDTNYSRLYDDVWARSYYEVYSNFSGSNPQLVIKYQDGGAGSITTHSAYNSFGQITSQGQYASRRSYIEHYYYEAYTEAVKQIQLPPATEFNVYPVPVNDEVHVALSSVKTQSFTIGLYDISGRLLQQITTTPAADYNGALKTKDYATGTYLIRVAGTNFSNEKKILIVH